MANHNGSTALARRHITKPQMHHSNACLTLPSFALDHRRSPSAVELHREGFVCGLSQFVCNSSSHCNTIHHHTAMWCIITLKCSAYCTLCVYHHTSTHVKTNRQRRLCKILLHKNLYQLDNLTNQRWVDPLTNQNQKVYYHFQQIFSFVFLSYMKVKTGNNVQPHRTI